MGRDLACRGPWTGPFRGPMISYRTCITEYEESQIITNTMGICVQKSSFRLHKDRASRSNYRESFLYSSFTYDPYYTPESGFFFFDVPHYCEIQYALRKNSSPDHSSTLEATIEQHIAEIQSALASFMDPQFRPGLPTSQLGLQTQNKTQNSKTYQNRIQKFKQQSVVSQESGLEALDNVLNFQLVSARLTDWENLQQLTFEVSLDGKKILSVGGGVAEGKWKPTSPNRVSLPKVQLRLEDVKEESSIKIRTRLNEEQFECTVPCNKIVFKYIIPVVQTSNIRGRGDNQPLGHVHFKIEYVGDFQEHRKRVVQDLMGRKKGLEAILARLREKESPNDKSLIVEDFSQSFRSELRDQ